MEHFRWMGTGGESAASRAETQYDVHNADKVSV